MDIPDHPARLRVDGLHVAYPGQPPLVSNWSATLGPGVHLLFGDTGSGKSTLLRVLAGETPAAGGLALGSTRLDTAGDPGRDAYRRHVFWCEPGTQAFDALTPAEAIAALAPGSAPMDTDAWQWLVDGFSLTPHLAKPLYMLSTGSKRKVWLAAALASTRPLVLLDEPTAALDGPSIACLWEALGRIAAAGERTAIVASSEPIDRVALAGTITLPLA